MCIDIAPGKTFKIKVTRKIHTAADYLLRDVTNDTIPTFQWAGAEGRPFRVREGEYQKSDELRKKCLLEPNAGVGAVLFYLQEDGQKVPNCQGGANFHPRPQNVIVYDPNQGLLAGKNSSEKVQHLWGSVNDMLLMDSSEDSKWAYLGTHLSGKELPAKTSKWEHLKKSDYKKFWFDDNIGNYVVSIIIED